MIGERVRLHLYSTGDGLALLEIRKTVQENVEDAASSAVLITEADLPAVLRALRETFGEQAMMGVY